MSSVPRIYSDANPIIELAKYAKGVHDPAYNRDIWLINQMLKAAHNKELDLYTSTISVAECVAVGDDWGHDVQEFFVGVLTSGRMFKLVQDSIFVAERARDLRWKDNIRLKGMDAIHVASALEQGCTEFLTWDGGIRRNNAASLATLGLNVILPRDTKMLPPYYLFEQQTLAIQ